MSASRRTTAEEVRAEHVILSLVHDQELVIDDEGRVWRHWVARGHLLYPLAQPRRAEYWAGRGYLKVSRTVEGRVLACQAHRLVYLFHKGPIPEGYEVDHGDRVLTNNHPDNLEAVTHQENIRRLYEWRKELAHDGRRVQMTRKAVEEMRRLAAEGWTRAQLCARFLCSDRHAYEILRGRAWPPLDGRPDAGAPSP